MVDTDRVGRVVHDGIAYLYRRQRPDGSWQDRLASSAHATSLAVIALSKLDPERHKVEIGDGLAWLRAHQRDDGGWSDAEEEPPSSKSGTAFAIAALHALDTECSRGRVENGMRFLDDAGGVQLIPGMSGPNPKTWPAAAAIAWALVGLRPLAEQPPQPIEVMLLPPALRNKISVAIPGVLALGVMQAHLLPRNAVRRALRPLAEARALAWLRAAQARNGGFEESPMLTAVILIGLRLAGVAEDLQERCRSYLLATRRDDGSWAIDRDLELSTTRYVVSALEASCDPAAEPRLRATRDWLSAAQWTEPFTPVRIPPGGWAWAMPSGWPEADDTAGALVALDALGVDHADAGVAAGLRWLLSRQNRDGSWSGWVRNGSILNDGPCPAVTAEVVTALNRYGVGADRRSAIGRALRYIAAQQTGDGTFPALWFRKHVFGTARVVEAYAELGRADESAPRRARQWLAGSQRPDGAWCGEGARQGTAEETGWAVHALLAAGAAPSDPGIVRGVEWLVAAQEGATWRPAPVGLYFATLRYTDDLIAHASALRALGRWLAAARRSPRARAEVTT